MIGGVRPREENMPNSLKLWHGETRAMEIIGVHRDYDDQREKFFGKQD